jgi:adenylylsulfate kinase
MDKGSPDKSPNVVWHKATVTRARRETLHRHNSYVLWFTGLSGSGKSTLAHAVEESLHGLGVSTFVFDGDNVRHGLCSDLSFSEEDRKENIRRIGEMTKLFVEAGVVAMTAFISPFREERKRVRGLFPHGDFIEVYCNSDLAVCEERDVKGLYAKARAGLIKNYTGISSPYEAPERPEIEVRTDQASIEDSVAQVLEYLRERGLLPVADRA